LGEGFDEGADGEGDDEDEISYSSYLLIDIGFF
jgi:hypothetical protein